MGLEHVFGELPMMGATLHPFPFCCLRLPIQKLVQQETTQERPDADAGLEVTFASDLVGGGFIVTLFGMVERHLHESIQGQGPIRLNGLLQEGHQGLAHASDSGRFSSGMTERT